MTTKSMTFNKVAEALLMDYTSIYYVNIRTNEYRWYSFNPDFHALQIEQEGKDFFVNMVRDVKKVVYEEDQPLFTEELTKEKMLEKLKNDGMYSIVYRLMIDGRPVYHTLRLIREVVEDEEYLILGVLNIDEDMRGRKAAEKVEREREAFNNIAEGLASRYDVIYYVDLLSGVYTQIMSGEIYGEVEIKIEGNDFFAESVRNAEVIIHPEDRDRIMGILDRDYLITKLEERKEFTADYRLMIDGRPQHTRLHVIWSADRRHFIIGVENIENEVKKEQEMTRSLKLANEMARRDELTGVKNKNAFSEFQRSIEKNIAKGKQMPFAIVLFDLNELKEINDTQGHIKGDEYLVRSCRMICKAFSHSPVFRVGGDEFVAFLMNRDYKIRDMLMERFRQQVLEHVKNEDGPVIAGGMAVYDSGKGDTVASVLERADMLMYENKERLKAGAFDAEDPAKSDRFVPSSRKHRLNQLFDAFSAIADGQYVFLCDMKYDYSRWSKAAVDYFGMPDEYMYSAGYIWEEHIHEEDKPAYRRAMDEVFFEDGMTHDMQYRARNAQGDDVICTCRGTVLTDSNGDSEYFCGTIRLHGVHEQVDYITGLRNQYGFLEDLKATMERRTEAKVMMIGISRFSELNNVYGYKFGNVLLQKVGRYLYETVANEGNAYRLDGTKFALINFYRSEEALQEQYEELRAIFRDGFYVGGKYVILELNAGLLTLDNHDINDRTAYACLTFAYGQSKNRRHGDLVKFTNYMDNGNTHQIEKIQAIRASIPLGFRGFYLTYQPVVDAETGKLRGAEALIRWKNEEYGEVPPGDFVPILEQDSLFPELGRWILRTAIRDSKKMLEQYPDFIVDVNLAYTQIDRPGFTDEILEILEEEDYPADHLCLEITERCRMLDLDLLNNVVVILRSKGIRIALDDFGTGYASVGILKDLPMDMIKIDRGFVQNVEVDRKEREMIGAFSETASLYGATVCVEGIETEGMVSVLRAYPIQSFQGYYYTRPLPFEDFRAWAQKREPQDDHSEQDI